VPCSVEIGDTALSAVEERHFSAAESLIKNNGGFSRLGTAFRKYLLLATNKLPSNPAEIPFRRLPKLIVVPGLLAHYELSAAIAGI